MEFAVQEVLMGLTLRRGYGATPRGWARRTRCNSARFMICSGLRTPIRNVVRNQAAVFPLFPRCPARLGASQFPARAGAAARSRARAGGATPWFPCGVFRLPNARYSPAHKEG